jgi:hypothetical protein
VDDGVGTAVEGQTRLELVVPPDPNLLRIVRLVASGLASLADLDLDGVEEVRVAADEVVSTLIAASRGSAGEPVHVRLTVTDTSLCLDASTALGAGSTLHVDPMADRVLEAVASRFEWWTDGDGVAHARAERDR